MDGPFKDVGRITCNLCDDPEADWPNTDRGMELFEAHAKDEHDGDKEYIVRV